MPAHTARAEPAHAATSSPAGNAVAIRLGGWRSTLVSLNEIGARSVEDLVGKLAPFGFVVAPREDEEEYVVVSGSPLPPDESAWLAHAPRGGGEAWSRFQRALAEAYAQFAGTPEGLRGHRGSGAFTFSWPPGPFSNSAGEGGAAQALLRATALVAPEHHDQTSLRLLALLLYLATARHTEHGGLILHSSAVARDGDGFLFLGESDAGKTSVATWSREANRPALGDDVNFLIARDEGFLVAAAPSPKLSPAGYSQETPSVRAVFLLHKADEDALVPLSPMRTASALFAAFLQAPPGGSLSPDAIGHAFGVACRVSRLVPGYELHFKRGPSFWRLIDRELPPRECLGA